MRYPQDTSQDVHKRSYVRVTSSKTAQNRTKIAMVIQMAGDTAAVGRSEGVEVGPRAAVEGAGAAGEGRGVDETHREWAQNHAESFRYHARA